MIITLTKADFSSCKIGTLTTFNVRKSTVIGASVNISLSSVERAGYSVAKDIATITLNTTNYERHAVKVMMGSTDVSSWYSSGKVTIPANTPITSNITISVSATAVGGGEDTTMCTLTIIPTPSTATVTLTASGYSQSGNSITVPANTSVTWKVSANGYTQQTGTHTVTKTESKSVTLIAVNTPVNLFTLKNSLEALLDNGYYRTTSGEIYDEESDYNSSYPSTEKIYINGYGGDSDFKLNLQSGKVYRWECVPYYEYGYIKLGPPWGLNSSQTGKNYWFYDNTDKMIANDSTTMTDKDSGGYCMSIPEGAVYMRFLSTGFKSVKSKVHPTLRDRLMVTEGETQYTDYIEPIV